MKIDDIYSVKKLDEVIKYVKVTKIQDGKVQFKDVHVKDGLPTTLISGKSKTCNIARGFYCMKNYYTFEKYDGEIQWSILVKRRGFDLIFYDHEEYESYLTYLNNLTRMS